MTCFGPGSARLRMTVDLLFNDCRAPLFRGSLSLRSPPARSSGRQLRRRPEACGCGGPIIRERVLVGDVFIAVPIPCCELRAAATISSTRVSSATISWALNRRCPSSERLSSTNSVEPMDSVVFDARRVEPHPVVRAGVGSVAVLCPEARHPPPRCSHTDVSAAAMLPHPTGNWNAVTVTQGVNHRSDTRQVMAATGETMPPTMPSRSLLDHCCTVNVIGVRPLLAQLTEFYDPAAVVVVSHPTGKLIGCDGGNEHSDGGGQGADCGHLHGTSPPSCSGHRGW